MARAEPRWIGFAVLLPLLSGCTGGLIATVGPDYQTPTPLAP